MKKLESSVEKAFVRKCKRLGLWQIKIGFDSYPDRMVLLPDGRVRWVEFKRPGETLRPNQKRKVKRLEGIWHIVEIVDSNEQAIALAETLSKENS